MSKLNSTIIYDVLKKYIPKQNDYFKCDYTEELEELLHFEINTSDKFENLIKKHIVQILDIDKEQLDDYHIKFYKQEFGETFVDNCLKNNFWFAYPALLRIALELEFGEAYQKYADLRDSIDEN